MQGNHFTVSYHTAGTLAANHVFTFIAPFDCQLEAISAGGSNTNSGLIIAGPSTSTAAYLASSSIGDGSVPIEFDRDNFVGGEYPHIAKGVIVTITLDYDGAGGTATADFTLVLTFSEG